MLFEELGFSKQLSAKSKKSLTICPKIMQIHAKHIQKDAQLTLLTQNGTTSFLTYSKSVQQMMSVNR